MNSGIQRSPLIATAVAFKVANSSMGAAYYWKNIW